MGRGMLLIITGSFVIFGMIQLGVFDRQTNINNLNVTYWTQSQARNVANMGMEHAFKRLADENSWRTTLSTPVIFNYRDDYAELYVLDNSVAGMSLPFGVIEVRSRGFVGEEIIEARAQLFVSGGLPPVDAAMGIFTENIDFEVAGSAFLINGTDTNPDGTPGPVGDLPGISVNNPAAYNEIMTSMNSTQMSRVQGMDPDPESINSIGGTIDENHPSLNYNPAMDAEMLEEFVQRSILNADVVYDNFTASGEGSLGTPDNPQVIVVNGILDVQNATGAGILIITESGLLDARGNFDNYQGLVIVQGSADMTRGNINIFGAMLFGGENPQLEIDIDFRGNVGIQYSSQVLTSITDNLYSTAAREHRILTYVD
ncbi:MAG TPA: hypothetical protein DCE78_03485 [Bacteroidetes bacterium]|nr:hypothetical protein [Bacteroidota bacterium]